MGEFTSGFFMGDQATNGRILVVDDEADIRKVVRMTLQKAGYDVLEAENGEQAIETINSGENRLLLDILVCDIRMPKINGVEAIAYFRANYPESAGHRADRISRCGHGHVHAPPGGRRLSGQAGGRREASGVGRSRHGADESSHISKLSPLV